MIVGALRLLVRGYRYCISPLLPPSCRFHPSCSAYAEEALGRYGAVKGGWLTTQRLCRCGLWSRGGFDPVPEPAPAAVPAASTQP